MCVCEGSLYLDTWSGLGHRGAVEGARSEDEESDEEGFQRGFGGLGRVGGLQDERQCHVEGSAVTTDFGVNLIGAS